MRITNKSRCASVLLIALTIAAQRTHASEFGAEVITCVPAPGQFINSPTFNEPANVIGPPSSAGTNSPNNASVLSLGGFGGSVVIRFDTTVYDEPGNYLGLDFIVYGNAYWASNDPQRRWGEPAHVEIMRDVNSDGLPGTHPDEVWYLIPGSMTSDASSYRAQTWDDVAGGPFPPDDTFWFPLVGTYPYEVGGPCEIPIDNEGRYTTTAFEIPTSIYDNSGSPFGIIANPNAQDTDPENDLLETYFGYAELSPTLRLGDLDADNVVDDPSIAPEVFYTIPDNPFRVGVTPGSGGGDAFDIAWAVDPATWLPAQLDGFDFVRITSAVDDVLGPLGEISSEIDAVADVRPLACPGDLDGDAQVTLVDLIRARNLLGTVDPEPDFKIAGDVHADGIHDTADLAALRGSYLGTTCD